MTDDLGRLIADLDALPAKAHFELRGVTDRAAKRAETQARKNASGRKHLPHYPKSIHSEMKVQGNKITGTVGVHKGGQGSLGHLIEYGSPTSGAHMDVNQAVDGETPHWLAAIARIGGRLL